MTSAPAGPRGAPLPTVFAFGIMGAPVAALTTVAGIYLPRYYVGLGLGFIAVVAAITAVRAIDIFFDPSVSLVMDRTKTPIGRYRPWLILAAPIIMLATGMLLAPHAHLTPSYLILWLLVAYAGLSIVTLGLAAWGAVLATGYNDRSRVYGWLQGLSVSGSVGILLLPPMLTHDRIVLGKASSMPAIAWIVILALPICLFICTVFTPERIAPSAARPRFSLRDMLAAVSRPAMLRVVVADLLLSLGPGTTAPLYIYFFHDAKGFTLTQTNQLLVFAIAAGVIGSPFWGRLARRFNKHRTVQIACVGFAICQTILLALPKAQFAVTAAGMFGVGFCFSAFIPLVRAMVADVTDEVRLEQRQDLTSLLFSMVTTTEKIASTIAVLIVFPILAMFGYNGKEGATNTQHAIFGLDVGYMLAPILVLAGAAMFFGYRLDPKRHALVRAALDERDAASRLSTG